MMHSYMVSEKSLQKAEIAACKDIMITCTAVVGANAAVHVATFGKLHCHHQSSSFVCPTLEIQSLEKLCSKFKNVETGGTN